MNSPAIKSPNLNESDVTNISSGSQCEDDSSLVVNKKRKTYEKKKESENHTSFTTASPKSENITTPSPNNTSRYGRTRRPKITEDFYNTEDIFGPYERIPCSPLRSSPKKKSQIKLELSPNKNQETVTISADKSLDLTSVLSINIPEDSIEVSKVLKIVTNNSSSDFSPKSPALFSKPVKTYANRHKKNSETVYESFGLPDYPAPVYLLNTVPMSADPLAITENSLVLNGDNSTLLQDPLFIGDETVFPTEIPKPTVTPIIIKHNMSLDLETSPTPKIVVEKLSDDSFSKPKNSPAIVKTNKENNEKPFKKLKQPRKQKLESSTYSTFNENGKKKVDKLGKRGFKKKKFEYKVVGRKKSHKKKIIPMSSDTDHEKQIPVANIEKPAQNSTLKAVDAIFRPNVGSICWSRVGSFPFWPSIVSNEPDTDCFCKTKIHRGRHTIEFYHVHFFGDNGRRSWVNYTHLFPFHDKTDLEQMAKCVLKEAKPKDPRHISAFIIPSAKLATWETAVSEAESITKYSQETRMKQFFELVVSKRLQKRNFDSIRSPNSEKPKKKKLKLDEGVSAKKLKKKLEKLNTDDSKQSEKGKTNISDASAINRLFGSRRKSLRIYEISKSCPVSDNSESESDTPAKKSSAKSVKHDTRDTPSPTPSLSSVPKKKINLFKGVTRERVCQLCGKGKNVFKCKGTCFGYYHIKCDKLQQSKLKIKIEEEDKVKIKDITSQTIVEEILEDILTSAAKALQKTPSLSLAEKIDLKMQEVMQNILSEVTIYADTTDSCSESDDCCELQPSVDQTNLKKKTKPNKRYIKHVTADGVLVIEDDDIDEDTEDELIMSKEELENYKCTFCATNTSPPCFICNAESTASGDELKHRCMTPQCGRYYHGECLKEWPQTKWYTSMKSQNINNEELSCPHHNCHTCISDDPRAPLARQNNEKLSKCIRCPTTYHINSYCIPAGSQILTAYQIICPKHLGEDETTTKQNKMKLMHHVNTSWCFICSMGGSLICCETCPSSFHVECLKLTPPEGKYICEECESGRLPLYDDVVWVKLGAYRWWPAQILFPSMIPEKVNSMAHHKGEFVVRFFGSHDHYWVNRGRVFLFQEGDTGHSSSKKNAVDWLFIKAIKEATVAHKQFMDARQDRVADYHTSMKPPSYVKIKVNKPVGAIKSVDADTSNTTPCDCDPKMENPCGLDSDCLNRILLTECQPMVCAAGQRCCNQSFQNRRYTPVKPFKTAGKGWGLKTLAPLKKGTFVIEYVGEVINESEYKRRMKRKHEQKDENYYFLTIDKDRMIDAGPKGNVARFMNHSCSPNCETQKWTVNGDTKVGLFAIKEIAQGAELTFNYNLECIGEEKKECRCGAPNCSGFIGAKAKQDKFKKKRKSYLKTKKKKPVLENVTKKVNCFKCGGPDALQKCDREACNKVYHNSCVKFKPNQEGKWFCPWHSCNICSKRTIRSCFMCMNSFCPVHSVKNIRYDRVKGFICSVHDSRYYRNRNGRRSKLQEQDSSPGTISVDKNTKTKEKNNRSKSRQSIHDPEHCVDEEDGNVKKRISGRVSRADNLISRSSRHSSPVLESSVKRPNGAYSVENVRNQNNNVSEKKTTIHKRKYRMSLKHTDDEDLDDVPLKKRLKTSSKTSTNFLDLDDSPLLDRLKKNLDTEIESEEVEVPIINRLQMQSTNVEITDDHEEEITSSLSIDDTPISERVKRMHEVSIADDNTPILQRLKNISKTNIDTNEDDSEICNAFNFTPKSTDKGSERPRSEFRRFTRSLSRTDVGTSPTMIEEISKSDSKDGRSRKDRKTPVKLNRKKRSISLSHFKHTKKTEDVEEAKDIEKSKELKKSAKKPIGRPRKHLKTKKLQESEKVNETLTVEESKPKETESSINIEEEKPPEIMETSSDKTEPEILPEKIDKINVEEDILTNKLDKSMEEKTEEDKIEKIVEEPKADTIIENPEDIVKENELSSGKDDLFPEYSHLVTISDNADNSSEDKFTSASLEDIAVSIIENVDNLQEGQVKEAELPEVIPTETLNTVVVTTEALKTPKKRLTRQSLTSPNEDLTNLSTKPEDTVTKNSVTSTEPVIVATEAQLAGEEPLLKSPKKRYTRYNLSLLRNEGESSDSLDGVTEVKQIEENNPKKRLTRQSLNITNHVDSSNSNSLDMAEDVNNLLKDLKDPVEEDKPPKKLDDEASNMESSEKLKSIDQDKNEIVKNVTESQTETEDVSRLPQPEKKPFIKKFNLSLRKCASSKDIPSGLTTKQQKLLNPRPGIRKSSRYSLPDSSTENIANHVSEPDSNKGEIKTIDNSSKSVPFKKKVLKSGIRKSARFSKSNVNNTISNSPVMHHEVDNKTEEATDLSSSLFPRKRGRFNKKPVINFTELVIPQETQPDVYKMKFNNDSRAKTFDNHINDVKLTANVPERHLRVILRKTEFESRSDSKFIKMQNDIEKDLPIRKRSKLRYENQLPE